MADSPFDIKAVQTSGQAFDAVTRLRGIHNEAEYDRTLSVMNALLDVAGDDEDHDLGGLLEIVADMVWKYEHEHHAIEAVAPKRCAALFDGVTQPEAARPIGSRCAK